MQYEIDRSVLSPDKFDGLITAVEGALELTLRALTEDAQVNGTITILYDESGEAPVTKVFVNYYDVDEPPTWNPYTQTGHKTYLKATSLTEAQIALQSTTIINFT